jgi:hypothetical protein
MIVMLTGGEQVRAAGKWPSPRDLMCMSAPMGSPAWPHAARMLDAMVLPHVFDGTAPGAETYVNGPGTP